MANKSGLEAEEVNQPEPSLGLDSMVQDEEPPFKVNQRKPANNIFGETRSDLESALAQTKKTELHEVVACDKEDTIGKESSAHQLSD